MNMFLPKDMDPMLRIFLATAIARVISSAVNYTVNKNKVFKSKGHVRSSLLKYYCLCVAQALCSYALVYFITYLTHVEQSILQTVYKMIVDIVLFFLCFTLQREWVFKEKNEKK